MSTSLCPQRSFWRTASYLLVFPSPTPPTARMEWVKQEKMGESAPTSPLGMRWESDLLNLSVHVEWLPFASCGLVHKLSYVSKIPAHVHSPMIFYFAYFYHTYQFRLLQHWATPYEVVKGKTWRGGRGVWYNIYIYILVVGRYRR